MILRSLVTFKKYTFYSSQYEHYKTINFEHWQMLLHVLYKFFSNSFQQTARIFYLAPQWVLTKCSIFGNCKVNDIYDPKVYILGSHNQLKMNFYHCKHFHKSRFTFFGNFAYVILESVNFKMIFQPSSGLRWLSG